MSNLFSYPVLENIREWKELDNLPIIKKSLDSYPDPRSDTINIVFHVRFFKRYTLESVKDDFRVWKKDYPQYDKDTDDGDNWYHFDGGNHYSTTKLSEAIREKKKRLKEVENITTREYAEKYGCGREELESIEKGDTVLHNEHFGSMLKFTSEIIDVNPPKYEVNWDGDEMLMREVEPASYGERSRIVFESIKRQMKKMVDLVVNEAYPLDRETLYRVRAKKVSVSSITLPKESLI